MNTLSITGMVLVIAVSAIAGCGIGLAAGVALERWRSERGLGQ